MYVSDEYKSVHWANMTSRECGAVGGQMVKKMVEEYQNQLANGSGTQGTQSATESNNYNLANKAGQYQPQQ